MAHFESPSWNLTDVAHILTCRACWEHHTVECRSGSSWHCKRM